MSEATPLLNGTLLAPNNRTTPSWVKTRATVWSLLTLLFIAALVLVGVQRHLPDSWAPFFGNLPRDPLLAANVILSTSPIIDGHIDLPFEVREVFANNLTAFNLNKRMPGHVDIPRLREGKVGGFFWSVYVPCPNPAVAGPDFLNATWRVRDTLEQIDVTRLLVEEYSDTFHFATNADQTFDAIQKGKISSLIGIEGAHQLGNSLPVLRMYQALGAKYLTLTHSCHNAFADSCGPSTTPLPPLHYGLSSLGESLIAELNRLSMFVDLSHTSDLTMKAALRLSKAPVIWSHSSARGVFNHPRNVPDDVLELVGTGKGQKDAVIMVTFVGVFLAPEGAATISTVADHIEHIARVAGKKHVGIGSDYDGTSSLPSGLEDVSKLPALFAELIKRGWTRRELSDLAGGNVLRVMREMERVGAGLRKGGAKPSFDVYEKREDLPQWPYTVLPF